MFTRCPGCQSVYELNAQRLAEAAGVVRCGHCGKTFNALSALFNDHPRADDDPLSGAGMPPMLDHRAIVQPELPGVSIVEPEPVVDPQIGFGPLQGKSADHAQNDESNTNATSALGPTLNLPSINPDTSSAAIWTVASLTLALVLVAQLGLQISSQNSGLRQWFGSETGANDSLDPRESIQITSRDMHRHPSLDDAVIVSATLRNQADSRLPWPVLEVRLYDGSQQVIGVRRLQPEDYLVNPENAELGMPSELLVPVIIEFVVGTTLPSGFDFRFF